MQSALRPPVPSHGLLRYLRIQARAAPLFAPSQSAPSLCRRTITVRPSARRPLSTACQRRRGSCSGLVSDSNPIASRLRTRPSSRTDITTSQSNGGAAASFSTLGSVRRRRDNNADKNKKCEDRPPSWQERLWGYSSWMGPKAPPDLPVSDDLADSSSMFSIRRNLSAKAAMEQRLRCTEVDENGQVILVDGEFKKTELIAKYGLLPRDLRKIDSSNLPHILVRPSAILLNLLHLKVLIKKDRVLLFDVYGSQTSYPQSAFMYDLQGKLQQKSPQQQGGANANAAASGSTTSTGGLLPYEFRALEAVLTSVTSELEADFEAVRDPVIRILSELEDDIDRHKLRILLILSKRVSTFEQKAKLVRDAIEELLEADDDLSAMYLTEKAHDLYRGLDDHTEVELLLESYHKLCDEVVQEAQNLVSSIRNTEEIVRAILDANRNALMLLELKFSVGTLGLAMGTFLAGLYGMNLENFIEETNWGFGAVTGVSVFFSLVVCWYGLVKLRKIQRVRMMGDEKGNLARNRHWFQDDGPLGLLEARNRERLRRMHQMKNINKKK